MSRVISVFAVAVSLALAPFASEAKGADYEPSLSVSSLPTPTAFPPADSSGSSNYDIRVANLGGAVTDGTPITVVDTLPAGLTVDSISLELRSQSSGGFTDYGSEACDVDTVSGSSVVTCVISASLPGATKPEILAPGEERQITIRVDTPAVPDGLPLDNTVEVEGGGAAPATFTSHNEVSSVPAEGGLAFFRADINESDGQPAGQAATHPYQMTIGFAVKTRRGPLGGAPFIPAGGDIKDIEVTLPPGLIGNPTAVTRCTPQQFNTTHNVTLGSGGKTSFFSANECPDSSAIGLVLPQQVEGEAGILAVPLYNLKPPPGMPAQFGAQILGLPFYVDTEVRPDDGYKVVATLRNLTQVKRLTAATTVIWGTPADPAHDPVRGSCLNELPEIFPIELDTCERQEATPPFQPFLRLPTNCFSPLSPAFAFDSWTQPGAFLSATETLPAMSACDQVPFAPSLALQPTTAFADSPTGLHAQLHLPQDEDSSEPGTADLQKAEVKLPPGLVVNPSGANGLAACSPAEVGLVSAPGEPPRFDAAAAHCPPAARVGTARVDTPLLDHILNGDVYVATPKQNPFSSLLALYITADDPESGVVLKLAGQVAADPQTGQLSATFTDTPQVPFEDFDLDFFGGPFAALRTPALCGSHTTVSTMSPWSAPGSGPPVVTTDPFEITGGAGGSPCPRTEAERPHAPDFLAGTISPRAGEFSPFVLSLQRQDGSQELAGLSISLPPGLLGKIAGIPYCPENVLATISARDGRAEMQNPGCPSESVLGRVIAGAGAGASPYFTQGTAYLAGPYKGAPLSLAVVTPAVAGPYDLGTIVVRVSLFVDPTTSQIRAVSDPIPSILQGIPLDVRSLLLSLDKPQFTLNPTGCGVKAVAGEAISTIGRAAPLSSPFQAEGCSSLRFKPRLKLSLSGGTKRNQNPALKAVLTNPTGTNANLAGAAVVLPRSMFFDNDNFRTICTRVQFSADKCPKGSIYGRARAFTPLLDKPLEGRVYLRSSSNVLPDLVVDLEGQIPFVVVGRIDSVKRHLRTVFQNLPDAPVSKFVLELSGGKRGVLVNSVNICRKPQMAGIRLSAHNGKLSTSTSRMKTSCRGRSSNR